MLCGCTMYCLVLQVKSLFTSLKVEFATLELDQIGEHVFVFCNILQSFVTT